MKYVKQLEKAKTESFTLGIEPRLVNEPILSNEVTKDLSNFCETALQAQLINIFGKGYWGQNCLNIAAQTFAILQHIGVPCELVYGEVMIGTTPEFDTTLEGLKKSLSEGNSNSGMEIHVWVNIGKDFIIDPTVCSRINKYYDSNCPVNHILNGQSNSLMKKLKITHIPMLAGVKFLEKTCQIPLSYNASPQLNES